MKLTLAFSPATDFKIVFPPSFHLCKFKFGTFIFIQSLVKESTLTCFLPATDLKLNFPLFPLV